MTPEAGPGGDSVTDIASGVFGWDTLRPGQREAVDAVLAGRDVVLVLPTGGGRSAAYQLPTVLRGRPTLVVSPLLSLQRDQASGLRGLGLHAVTINSEGTGAQQRAALVSAASREADVVFVSPEQLANEDVRAALADVPLGSIAVDEAHCVSSWGHDFRPDYLRLGKLLDSLHDGHHGRRWSP